MSAVISGAILRPGEARLSTWLLVAMPLLALIPRCFLILHSLYPDNIDVFDTGFGFGGYVRSLLGSGEFRSCGALPFKSCQPGICVNATRMPGIPLLLALLSAGVGTPAKSVAVAKCFLLALAVAGFIRVATQNLRVSLMGVAVLYGLYFGPQPLKHGASMAYEEGVLLDMSLCLAIAMLYLVRNDLALHGSRRSLMAIAAVAIAIGMYFTKATALLTLAVVMLIVLTHPALQWQVKAGSLALLIVPFSVWAGHTYASSGVVHLSSSWNGENLFRGYNSEASVIYPEITLDRLFDSSHAVLEDGTVVPLGNYSSRRCFKDEWAWSDYYAVEARHWAVEHPLAVLQFALKKAWVALIEVRDMPKFLSATDKSPLYPSNVSALMIAWMVYARIVFVALIVMLLRDLRQRSARSHLWIALLLAAAGAPYILVFGFQRHVIPILLMAGAWFVFLYLAEPRISVLPNGSSAVR